jgi:hypothetical protein
MKMIKNAAGRLIPEIANGVKQIPYMELVNIYLKVIKQSRLLKVVQTIL